MIGRWFRTFLVLAVAAMILGVSVPDSARAQVNPPNNNNNNGGVYVDATGVVHKKVVRDPSGVLMRRRLAEAKARLPRDLATPSKLRKVSLNRLEAAVAESVEDGTGITDEMKYLAGLTRLRYVFYYPETNDLVIAGEAEGFFVDPAGQVIGTTTGRSVLALEDLVVALRAFAPDGKRSSTISVSIDPTKEGLARMQQLLRQIGGRATPGGTERLVNALRQSLGKHTITLRGVPETSHFAQVLVEADYRMKLIGVGLERPPIKIKSFVQRATSAGISRNALQRWFFVPEYECVRVSEDELAMELVGDGVRLVSEQEMVAITGKRSGTMTVDRASQAFVGDITRKYPELAAKMPIYAQLRNIIDMSIAAAYIQDRDLYGKASWRMSVFGDEKAFPVETFTAPKQVDTVINAIWKGRTLVTPLGGVNIQPRLALRSSNLLEDEGGKLKTLHEKVDRAAMPADQWWWD